MTALVFFWLAGDFIGGAACAECHAGPAARQANTHHAKSLTRASEPTAFSTRLAGETIRERSGLASSYRLDRRGLVVTAARGGEQASMPLEWVFGAGSKAQTAVGRLGGRYIEHRVSWYAGPQRFALTPGHPASAPVDAAAGLGLVQQPAQIARCFGCHSAGAGDGPEFEPAELGVRCERCHGPGRVHAEAARAKKPLRNTILNASRLGARGVVETCAQCHRSPTNRPVSSALPELDDPLSIRFSPVGFSASRCFQASKDFSCLRCHDPHENPRPKEDASYTRVCQGCHGAAGCKAGHREACIGCHMQQREAAPFLRFTDHRIRVYLGE